LRDPTLDTIKRYQVARFGRQLAYAWRHRIPAELLIGFIYQTGGDRVIDDKYEEPATYEAWWTSEISWVAEKR
jgi:hypothetical protein